MPCCPASAAGVHTFWRGRAGSEALRKRPVAFAQGTPILPPWDWICLLESCPPPVPHTPAPITPSEMLALPPPPLPCRALSLHSRATGCDAAGHSGAAPPRIGAEREMPLHAQLPARRSSGELPMTIFSREVPGCLPRAASRPVTLVSSRSASLFACEARCTGGDHRCNHAAIAF